MLNHSQAIRQLRFGNEFEAMNALNGLKEHLMDEDVFNEICQGYLFSDIDPVSEECGRLLGRKGRLKAHALFFRGYIH